MNRGSVDRAFGHELRVRREAAGLTAEQMWTALHMRKNTYWRTERGERPLSPEDILRVASFLNISAATFFAKAELRWQTGDYPNPSTGDEWKEIIGY